MNASRSGWRRTSLTCRACLTLTGWRSVATIDFLIGELQSGQQRRNLRVVNLDALCRRNGIAQLEEERDVEVLGHQFVEEGLIRGQFAAPSRRALGRGIRVAARGGSPAPILRLWRAKAPSARPPRDSSTRPQYTAETAPEAHSAKVLT